MDPQFWRSRWERGEIGWHSDEINPHLAEHWPQMAVPAGALVFVPLCGKSRDLLWLAGRGHPVLGVEISALAVGAFIAENALEAAPAERHGRFDRVDLAEIALWIGDFFDLRAEHLDGVGAVYDRASLIALPPGQRRAYAEHLAALLPAGVPVLLITLDYDQWQMSGPPFAVGEAELHRRFGPAFEIEPLASHDVLADKPRWRERGLTRLDERVYRLCRR